MTYEINDKNDKNDKNDSLDKFLAMIKYSP